MSFKENHTSRKRHFSEDSESGQKQSKHLKSEPINTLLKTTTDVTFQESPREDCTEHFDEKVTPIIKDQNKEVNHAPSAGKAVSDDAVEICCEQHSETPDTNSDTPYIRPEAEYLPTLYRLLSDDENIAEGLTTKNPNAQQTVAYHVALGSKQRTSQFISTSASISAVKTFLSYKLNSKNYKLGTKVIVEIDVASLPENVVIIDLRTQKSRDELKSDDSLINKRFQKFAKRYQEVLLVGRIPPLCLSLYNPIGHCTAGYWVCVANTNNLFSTTNKGSVSSMHAYNFPGNVEIFNLQEEQLLLEKHERKYNVLVYGLKEDKNENIQECIYNFMTNDLKIPHEKADKIPIANVHRIPSRQNDGRPNPIIIRFIHVADKQLFMSKGPKLAGKKISMLDDLPPVMKKMRHDLAAHAYKIRQDEKLQTRIRADGTHMILEARINVRDKWQLRHDFHI